MAADDDDLEILKVHCSVFLQHTQVLSRNIDNSITDNDISSKQNLHNYQLKDKSIKVKLNKTKTLILIF